MIGRMFIALMLAATPLPAAAQPVAVRLIWDGNDSIGGVLVNRVRGLIAASGDKREVVQSAAGLAVIVQTIDPAAEFARGSGEVRIHGLFVGDQRAQGRRAGRLRQRLARLLRAHRRRELLARNRRCNR
ncbi:hypothetical protein [Novosphingobium sp. Gsoil 351]|uniref:hypothetical protein n=1 Tax=Novosphingobium sp. Gsoil 351 TaxID=2675225 RepID=UPI0012B45C5B|nr:hypothetical protein [Novosphingobium sp. Gsoil 351]QGN53255.1 hypothetical protein GKE62_00480 [Novosphingobium sp. Gsoil 351]